jgi:hypothetical protein
MIWRSSFLSCLVWSPKSLQCLNGNLFLKLWEVFCYYFIQFAVVALVCTSSSSTPMIYGFGLIMLAHRSCLLHLYPQLHLHVLKYLPCLQALLLSFE